MKIRFSHCSILGCLFVLERILVWFNKERKLENKDKLRSLPLFYCLAKSKKILFSPVSISIWCLASWLSTLSRHTDVTGTVISQRRHSEEVFGKTEQLNKGDKKQPPRK